MSFSQARIRNKKHGFAPVRRSERMNKHPVKRHLCRMKSLKEHGKKIGADLFTHDDKQYLVTVCYKSNFWELYQLIETKSSAMSKKLKSHLARYSIPKQSVTDNGPQFTSSEFKSFAKKWAIEHTTTSPHHSKANGKVESAVKTAKKMLRKTSVRRRSCTRLCSTSKTRQLKVFPVAQHSVS